jgi:uncharacterized RDD family membrane protein YckC
VRSAGQGLSARAGLGRRLGSLVYEALLLAAVVFVAAFLFVSVTQYPSRTGALRPVFQLFLIVVCAVYFLWFWLHGGQTLAMKTWGVQLVAANGERLTLGRATLRLALAALGLSLGGASIVWALIDRERQFLHDRLAGTRLLRRNGFSAVRPDTSLPTPGTEKAGSG